MYTDFDGNCGVYGGGDDDSGVDFKHHNCLW